MLLKSTLTLAVLAATIAAPVVAQDMSDPTSKVTGEGMPDGWMARFDPARRGPEATAKDVNFRAMGPGMHHTSGPAGIYYRPADARSAGDFTVSMTISQAKSSNHEAYGPWIGGKDLQTANQNYLYMVVRPENGKFLINHRTSDGRPTNLVPYTASDAINMDAEETGAAKNSFAIRVHGDMIHFSINGTEVKVLYASEIEGFSTDGLAGIRLNHNLDVHISGFSVKD